MCGLEFAAMVPVEVYEERFSRLKELDPGKDKVIEVSCADDCSTGSQTYT